MRRLTVLLTLCALVVSGCADSTGGEPSPARSGTAGSGIAGTVLLGPQCPVEMENSPCPDRPVQADVEVRTDKQTLVTTERTAADGTFRIELEPGDYVVQPVPLGDRGITFGKPVDVLVVAGVYTEIDLLLDTGIR